MLDERIAVVTDGSLPTNSDLVDKVVPFYVRYIEEGEWKDVRGDSIATEEFLNIQKGSKKPPGTSQPSPIDFLRAFVSLADKGFNCILVLTVPESKSGTYNSAKQASYLFKEHRPKSRVNFAVFDTGTTAAGVEYLAEEALRMIGKREFFTHIVDRLGYLSSRIEIFLALDKIDYISASGRVEELSSLKLKDTLVKFGRDLAAWFARTTHRSPKVCISVKEGKEKIIAVSRFYPQTVANMGAEIERRALVGKEIRRIYIYQRDSEAETKSLLDRISLFSHGEVVVKDDLPIALLTLTGSKFVALICAYDHLP